MKKLQYYYLEKVKMKLNKKTINNITSVIRLLVVSPIVWFGTVGGNQICLNFTIFFSIFIGIVLIGFIIGKDKIKEDFRESEMSNEFLNTLNYLIPSSFLIADGWIITGLIWVLCWAVNSSVRSEIKKESND